MSANYKAASIGVKLWQNHALDLYGSLPYIIAKEVSHAIICYNHRAPHRCRPQSDWPPPKVLELLIRPLTRMFHKFA
jgi:hypothetical protein